MVDQNHKIALIQEYFSDFTSEQVKQFELLDEVYREWNEKINVISRKDIDGLYEKHILHSLAIAAAFEFQNGTEILDLGTGGGFPGVPLAIFFPGIKFLLVDSIAKKLKVIDAVVEKLELKNVKTLHSRVEQVKGKKYDYVVSRAVASLKDLWQWSKPIIKTSSSKESGHPNPGLICLKGGDLNKEIQESGVRPRIMEVHDIFPRDYFKEKYLLYVSR